MLCAWPLLPTAFAAGLVTRRIFVDKSQTEPLKLHAGDSCCKLSLCGTSSTATPGVRSR
jgi:hypothetical protein